MDDTPKTGVSVEQPSSPRWTATIGWAILAIAAAVALVDAAIETFWSGSPIRWWVAGSVLALVALSVWLWRPGGTAAKRWGWSGAAPWSIGGLLLLLAVTAWLPEGQVNGVRMLLQPTSTVLTAAIALAVLLAAYVLVRGLGLLPNRARLVARVVVILLAIYALSALGVAIRDHATFASLFQGGAVWQRLPRWLQGTFVGAFVLFPVALFGQMFRLVDHRNRKKPVLILLHQTVLLATALVVPLSGVFTRSPALTAGGSSLSLPFEMTADEIVRVIKAYQDVPTHADRAGYDVTARAATLTGTAEAFVFVRDQIANDLYPGVLRGAEGTLSAGAGNDVDKALLLARLLTEQQRTVRFAQCQLSEDKADERIRSVFTRPQQKSPTGLEAMLLAAMVRQGLSHGRAAEIVGARKVHEQAIDAAVATAAQADLTTIRETLHAANIVPAPEFDRAALVTAARSHVWVQVKEEDRWQDLDPAFTNAQRGAALCAAGPTMATLPPKVYQTLTVVVTNEYLGDGNIQAITALKHSFRTSELHARPTLFLNMPIPLEAVSAGGLAAVQGFVPVLVAADGAVHGAAFPLVSAASGNSQGMGSLLGPMAGGEAPSSPGRRARLVGQRLDFVIDAPGRRSIVSRTIFDGVRPDERANRAITTAPDTAQLARKISATYAIAVSTGRIDPVQLLEAAYAHIDAPAVGRVLSGLASGDLSSDTLSEFAVQHPLLLGARALRLAAELDRVQLGAWHDGYRHSVAFRDQPLIVIADLALGGPDAEAGLSFDLRHDEIRVMSADSGHAEEAFWLNAHHGLVDGAVERAALPSATILAGHQDWARAGGAHVVSMSAVSELARSSRIGFRAATGDDAVRALRSFGAPGGFRLADEVHENTAAIMPAKPVPLPGGDRLGIWALNLGTGHVIPLLDTGLRHAMALAAEVTAGPGGQPGMEYNETTRKTREIDLYWRTTQNQLDQTWKLMQKWNCFGIAKGTAQCRILTEAFNKLVGNASALKHQYWAIGEFLGGAGGL